MDRTNFIEGCYKFILPHVVSHLTTYTSPSLSKYE